MSKEDSLIDSATNVLKQLSSIQETKKPDEDDIYGQIVANSLRKIIDEKCKAFVKIKIQEILYQAQFRQTVPQGPYVHVQERTPMSSPNSTSSDMTYYNF